MDKRLSFRIGKYISSRMTRAAYFIVRAARYLCSACTVPITVMNGVGGAFCQVFEFCTLYMMGGQRSRRIKCMVTDHQSHFATVQPFGHFPSLLERPYLVWEICSNISCLRFAVISCVICYLNAFFHFNFHPCLLSSLHPCHGLSSNVTVASCVCSVRKQSSWVARCAGHLFLD